MLQSEFLHLGGGEEEGEVVFLEGVPILRLGQAGKYLFGFRSKFAADRQKFIARGFLLRNRFSHTLQLHQQRLHRPLGFLHGGEWCSVRPCHFVQCECLHLRLALGFTSRPDR